MIDDMNNKWAEFEKLGVKEVIQRLANGIWNEANTSAAKAWLDHKDRDLNLASKAEEISIARDAAASARDAAESARISAIAANAQAKVAKIALVIAALSFIISIISALYKNPIILN